MRRAPSIPAKVAFPDQIDHALHRFSFVYGIGHHALGAGGETDRFVGFGGRYAVGGIGVVRDQRQVVPGDLAAEIHQIGRVPRNFHHLFTGLIECAGGIDSHHSVTPPVLRESHQHPRMGRARHRAHHDMVEHDPHLGFLRTDLFGKAHVAEPAELVHRCACRYCIRLAAFGLDSFDRTLPAFPDPDVEAFIDEFDLRSHDAAHQDIADPVVDGILKRHPAFLDEVTFHAQLGGDRGHLTRVIRWVRRRGRCGRHRGEESPCAREWVRTPRVPRRSRRRWSGEHPGMCRGEGRAHDQRVLPETPQSADRDRAAEGGATPSERYGVIDREQDDPDLIRLEQIRQPPAGPGSTPRAIRALASGRCVSRNAWISFAFG